jgi:dihydrofolate reductase
MYMATTPNGIIAKKDDDTSFVSDVEWRNFRRMIKSTGNMIIGRRTYEIMRGNKEFRGLEKIPVIIVSKKLQKTLNQRHHIVRSPKDAVAFLKKQGFKKALVAGGSKNNSSFLKENIIDEIYLDVEPTIIGKGIPLFQANIESRLKLIGIRKLSRNEIQLHYKVLKK